MDICSDIAGKLSSTVESLSANWTIPDLMEDFESLKSRFEMVKLTIDEVKAALPSMHECYEFQTGLLEVLTWVQELLVVLEMEYMIDDADQIEEELNKLKVSIFIVIIMPSEWFNQLKELSCSILLLAYSNTYMFLYCFQFFLPYLFTSLCVSVGYLPYHNIFDMSIPLEVGHYAIIVDQNVWATPPMQSVPSLAFTSTAIGT